MQKLMTDQLTCWACSELCDGTGSSAPVPGRAVESYHHRVRGEAGQRSEDDSLTTSRHLMEGVCCLAPGPVQDFIAKDFRVCRISIITELEGGGGRGGRGGGGGGGGGRRGREREGGEGGKGGGGRGREEERGGGGGGGGRGREEGKGRRHS